MLKAIDPTGASLTSGQQAAMAGFATLLGGGLAGLAGANAQGGATAAQNEVLNNDDNHPADAAKSGGVLSTLSGAFTDALNALNWTNSIRSSVQGQFLSLLNGNRGQTGPSDANNQIPGGGDGNNTSGTAGAVVTPSVPIPTPYGGVVMTPPLVAPAGAPIISTNGSGSGSDTDTSGQGASSGNSGVGLSSTPSPALPDSPYSPSNVGSRLNPPYQTNPAHDTSSPLYNPSKTPEPADAQSAYESGAVRGNMYTWYAQGQGGYYRYFSDNAGTVHFSGTVPASQVPKSVLKILGK